MGDTAEPDLEFWMRVLLSLSLPSGSRPDFVVAHP
jgi:hypothetical protein